MAGQCVMDVTESDFQAAVLDRSREVPVVVDFWAPWCPPCRALGPLLEGLAAEAEAGEFGVQGIPAVFAVRDGEVVDQFTGLLPEDELRKFIGRLAPSASDKRAAEAAKLEADDPAAAETSYRVVLASDPTHETARVGLARLLLASPGQEEEAGRLVRTVEVGRNADEANRLRAIIHLRDDAPDLDATRAAVAAESGSPAVHVALGRALAARGEYLAALDELLAAAELDKATAKGAVRETMLAIFQVLGVRSDTADRYRARLQSLMY